MLKKPLVLSFGGRVYIDLNLVPIDYEAFVRSLELTVAQARVAKPIPHLLYEDDLSFTEKLSLYDIKSYTLNSSNKELEALECAGAKIAIQKALDKALNQDILLENVSGLIRFSRRAIKRYFLSLDQFHMTEEQLNLREHDYWFARGKFFLERLQETKGIKKTLEARTWFLHEIHLAMRYGNISRVDLDFPESLRGETMESIFQEMSNLFHEIKNIHIQTKERKSKVQRYQYLYFLTEANLKDYP